MIYRNRGRDLDREQDIEELRRIAHAQQAQIRILLEAIAEAAVRDRVAQGHEPDAQLTLKMLEALQAKAKAADDGAREGGSCEARQDAQARRRSARRARRRGRPSSHACRSSSRNFSLDDADRTCPSCGGELAPMKDQFDESEMIDVVEVSYRIVKVKQQKYVCRCGSCVETALGPGAGTAGQPLLARVCDQGRARQVARSHPARAPDAHPRSPRTRRDVADALGSRLRDRAAALDRRRRADRSTCSSSR